MFKNEKIEKDILHKSNQKKKAEVTTLVWDEIDFKRKNCY